MFDCEIVAKMQECQTAADARKVELVGAKDFEAAARWRDVSLALGRAIEYAARPSERGDKVVMLHENDGEWIDTENMPRSSTG